MAERTNASDTFDAKASNGRRGGEGGGDFHKNCIKQNSQKLLNGEAASYGISSILFYNQKQNYIKLIKI